MIVSKSLVVMPRVPTKKMLKAAAKAMSPSRRPSAKWVSVQRKHAIRYIAMRDAWLKESSGVPDYRVERFGRRMVEGDL